MKKITAAIDTAAGDIALNTQAAPGAYAAAATNTEAARDTVTADRATIQSAVEFFHSIKTADEMFRACQDKSFRQHAKSCIRAPRVKAAFEKLAEMIGAEA